MAAWKQAAKAEIARATGAGYAQILLDMVKAFERIPYHVLLREANRLGYPLRLLRLAIATYKMPRAIRVGEAISDMIWAVRGIVAGPGGATSELRWVMIDIVGQALLVYPFVAPTLFVDDLLEEADGDDDSIIHNLCGFTHLIVTRVTEYGM